MGLIHCKSMFKPIYIVLENRSESEELDIFLDYFTQKEVGEATCA